MAQLPDSANAGSLPERLRLLRQGLLSASEIASLVADAGKGASADEALADIAPLLDHEDAIVRYNALWTVAHDWGDDSRVDRIIEILLQDSDRDCREAAAAVLGYLFESTGETRVLDVLLRALHGDRVGGVQALAYDGVLRVIGVSRDMRPNPVRLEIGNDELLALDEYLKPLGRSAFRESGPATNT